MGIWVNATNKKIALEHIINYSQKVHTLYLRSPVGRKQWILVRHGTSARAGHNPRSRVQPSGCHDVSGFSTAKPIFLRANTVAFVCSCWLHCLHSRSSRSLSRGCFFYRLSTLSADRYFAKIMFRRHVTFERIFKNGVKFSLAMGCRYKLLFLGMSDTGRKYETKSCLQFTENFGVYQIGEEKFSTKE